MKTDAASNSMRVLLLAPTRRDAELARSLLNDAGIECGCYDKLSDVCEEIARGAAALMLPEEVVADPVSAQLRHTLEAQPTWSDLPVLIMARSGADSPAAYEATQAFGNVTLLERPLRLGTMISAIRTAQRARKRQYELRLEIARRAQLNRTLEQRVAERTAVAEERARQLSKLASELTQAESRERRRVAQVLHDHLQQLLVAAHMILRSLRLRVDESVQNDLEQVDSVLTESIEVTRSLAVDLSPPILYEAGLPPALLWLSRWMEQKHGLHVDLSTEPDADPNSENLRAMLFQIVRELLFNVVKHAKVSEAKLTLRATPDSEVEVCVEDRGAGFETRASEHGQGQEEHFGLLSIRERLQLLGGEMNIVSTLGKGTCITVRVPWKKEPALPLAEPAQAHAASSMRSIESRGQGAPIRVLLVDDHKIMREGLARLLGEVADIQIVGEACDGAIAVEMTRQLQPDVVVMDCMMPVMSGEEATRRIVQEMPHVRVIALSMHEESDMALTMRVAGAAAYLSKGGPVDDLVEQIRSVTATAGERGESGRGAQPGPGLEKRANHDTDAPLDNCRSN